MTKVLGFAAASLVLVVGMAVAGDPPDVKEGLWSIHRLTIENPGNKKSENTSTICRNHAYDQHVLALSKNVKGCTAINQSSEGSKYSEEMRCVVANTVVVTKGTTTYSGDAAAHAETHATYTPALAGMTEMTMIVDQRYVGSCPPGAQPGDLTTADGRVIHLWKH